MYIGTGSEMIIAQVVQFRDWKCSVRVNHYTWLLIRDNYPG